MFNVNNIETRTTPWTCLTSCFIVSMVNFEQEIAGRDDKTISGTQSLSNEFDGVRISREIKYV